jgi:mono/diheme cytochrome c family protein
MWRALLFVALAASPLTAAHADSAVRANYLLACRGCHLDDGRGVPPDVPSLRNTLGQFAASPPGRNYLIRVPGVARSRLNDDELADVINWVLTEFNGDSLPAGFTPISPREVAAARPQSLPDPALYRRRLLEGLVPE